MYIHFKRLYKKYNISINLTLLQNLGMGYQRPFVKYLLQYSFSDMRIWYGEVFFVESSHSLSVSGII